MTLFNNNNNNNNKIETMLNQFITDERARLKEFMPRLSENELKEIIELNLIKMLQHYLGRYFG